MKIESRGHVVLKVRSLERAEAFYHGVLGLPIATRWTANAMTFFTLGDHHDFAVVAMGEDAEPAPPRAPGLAHVAFKIGDSLAQLREARAHLEAAGVAVEARDHGVSQSLYMHDPDGNRVEVYIDASPAWRDDPSLVAHSEPLTL